MHISMRRGPPALGEIVLDPGNSPGHHAELAADGVGLLCSTQQLCRASLVQAVLRNNAAKFNKHLPIRSNLPCTGDKLVLALKQNRKKCLGREGEKRSLFLQDRGSIQEAQIYSETRKGLDAKFTSNQEEVISSALHKCSWCHSHKHRVMQGFRGKMCWGGGGEALHTMMGPFFLRN